MMRRLINKRTQQPIVEFTQGKATFHSRFLENEMRSIGINIPHGLRGIYHGKDTVRLDDIEFEKAFQEIYFLTTMDPTTFEWLD